MRPPLRGATHAGKQSRTATPALRKAPSHNGRGAETTARPANAAKRGNIRTSPGMAFLPARPARRGDIPEARQYCGDSGDIRKRQTIPPPSPASSEPPTPFSRRGRFPAGATLRGLSAADAFPKTFSCGGVLPRQTGAPENCSAPSVHPEACPAKSALLLHGAGSRPFRHGRLCRDAAGTQNAGKTLLPDGAAAAPRDRPPPCRSRQN